MVDRTLDMDAFASGQKFQMPPLDPQVFPKKMIEAGEQIQPGNPCQYERPPGVPFPLRHPAAAVWVIPTPSVNLLPPRLPLIPY